MDPVAEFVRMARAALVAAGLTRRESDDGLVWFEGGAGDETLVLIHGVNDHAGTWSAVVPALLARHRLLVPDLPGHGESSPADGPIEMPSVVDRIATLLPERATVVGNSMGAWVAILLALAHPDRVQRLVLESGGGLNLPLAAPLIATNRDEATMILRAVHGPHMPLAEWAIDALLARATNAPLLRMAGLADCYVDDRLGEIVAPTTIIWGVDDGVVPRAYVEALERGIAGAKLCLIDGAAHIPHMQQPERFLRCLTATS